MSREIVLDTETTGLDFNQDRVIEIGCIELVNHVPTGRTYWQYINPGQVVPAEAIAVHGITNEFLSDKPGFTEIVVDFLDFIGADARLVAHNASFDLGMLNAELKRAGFPPIAETRALDTAAMARRKFPGAPASLDALCRRFEVDNTGRTLHGALLDSELLAEVYLHLLGGRQTSLGLTDEDGEQTAPSAPANRPVRPPRPHAPSAEELAAHAALVEQLADPIWPSNMFRSD